MPRDLAAGREFTLVAQALRGFDQRPRVDIEHRLGVGLVAGLRVVAGEHQEVVDAERRRAHEVALQRDAVAVAAGELQDRLDARPEEERRRGKRAHVRPRAGAVGQIDRVGEPAQRQRLGEQVLRVTRDRRRNLRGHDEATGPQPLFKRGLVGSVLNVHCWLAAGKGREKRKDSAK